MVCHQSIRRLTMPKTPKSRAFYVITLRSGAKQNDLKEFLLKEWIPATRATPGCISVEMWEDHRSRAGYMILELWENKQIHFQNVSKLWGEEKKDVFQKLGQYGIMESNWGGEIINE